MVVPMRVPGSCAMPMNVGVPSGSRGPFLWRIQLVVFGSAFVVMVLGTVRVLSELPLEGMRMAAVIDHDGDTELMGLWNLLYRFPIGIPIFEPEKLPPAVLSLRLDSGDIDRQSGQAKMRRHPAFENRESQFAFIGREALLFRPVQLICRGSRIGRIVALAMTMSVTMTTCVLHFAERANRNPTAETDKSDTGRRVDDIAEPCGEGDSGDPHHQSDQQSRHDVADAGLE